MSNEIIEKLLEKFCSLNDTCQWLFLEKLVTTRFSEKKRLKWFNWNCHILYPKSKWLKIDRWMEGQFKRDMGRTPRMVASMCLNYFRVNSKMFPFLIKKAQVVKNRVYMRKVRKGNLTGKRAGNSRSG